MSKNEYRPTYFVAWRHNEENHWEVVSEEKFGTFCANLVYKEHVNPASIFFSMLILTNWLHPEYHNDLRDVTPYKVYTEINGVSTPSDMKIPDVPDKPRDDEPQYGFISPDGRYFHCNYGGHSSLAREIVGSIEPIDDPAKYLESKGWLVIYHDPINEHRYKVGMGQDMKCTDKQLLTLDNIGVGTNVSGIRDVL